MKTSYRFMYLPIGGDGGGPGLELSSVPGQSTRSPTVEIHLPEPTLRTGAIESPSPTAGLLKSKRFVGGLFCASVISIALVSGLRAVAPEVAERGVSHGFGQVDFLGDRVVMHDYDSSKVFSSFLPGIGGEYGIPMWAFYVG
jgi:hypothetical protein